MSGTWHRAASVDEIDPDFPLGVEVAGKHIALYSVDGRIYATADECTHAFARLSDGFVEGCHVLCPVHQGRFDVTSGEAVDGPVEDPVATYPVEVRDDQVYVEIASG